MQDAWLQKVMTFTPYLHYRLIFIVCEEDRSIDAGGGGAGILRFLELNLSA